MDDLYSLIVLAILALIAVTLYRISQSISNPKTVKNLNIAAIVIGSLGIIYAIYMFVIKHTYRR